MKAIKLVYLLLIFTFIAGIIIGLKTKASYSDYLHETDMDHYKSAMSFEYDSYINEYEQEFINAPCIVKVEYTGNRIFTFESVLSEVIILEVYRGNIKDDKIWIYEFVYFMQNHYFMLYSRNNIMCEGYQYIAFLQEPDYPKGYVPPKNAYMPANLNFPLLRTVDAPNVIVDGSKKEFTYSEIKQSEFPYASQKDIDEMNNFKHRIFDQFEYDFLQSP
jgi:hypothetical protein